MRVVVVGAGLAGLVAAQRLAQADVSVDVIEAGDRIGGRVRTVRDRFTAGQYVESGAEWIDTDHHRMLALLDRYGLSLQGRGQQWTAIRRLLFRDGVMLDPDQIRAHDPRLDRDLRRFEDALLDVAAGIDDTSRPDLHLQATAIDQRSLADLARDLDLGPLAAMFTAFGSQGEFAEEPHGVSMLFAAQQRAQTAAAGGGESVSAHRVDGGLGSLIAALAADVAVAVGGISMRERLLGVRWGENGVEVETDRRSIDADHVVLACSLVPLRRVRFDPALPGPLAAAVERLAYGTVTKTALQYPRREWRAGYANTTLPIQRVYEPTTDQSGAPGVLMAYTGGAGGRDLARLDETQRMGVVAGHLETMYGMEVAPLGGFSRAWSNEERFGGSYAVYAPGQVMAHWHVLRQPCGPVHLAGEHVASWTGYLEGAVESAERVAAELVASQ
ncbi:MAG: hypothetical protein RLZZ623_2014 [Actinomycetota bacterium]